MISRRQVFTALFSQIQTNFKPPSGFPQFVTLSMQLKDWNNVPAGDQPALFLNLEPQHARDGSEGITKWTWLASLWIYFRTDVAFSDDPQAAASMTVGDLLDALDVALQGTPPGERLTLGNLVYAAYIDGTVLFDPGITDPQAVVVVPITIDVARPPR